MLIKLNLKKMNHIVNNTYSLPLNIISQEIIFSNQLEKYIKIDSTVAILSSFPVLFLIIMVMSISLNCNNQVKNTQNKNKLVTRMTIPYLCITHTNSIKNR